MNAASDAVARAYDRWALTYDDDRNATRDLDALALRDSGLPVRDADVLELGCGTGKNSVWLAAQARSLTAMDFSPGMLERAQQRVSGDHVRFVHHDVRARWPVPSDSVDVVVGNLVLEHVEQLDAVFAEAYRVLRAGGVCYVAELHPYRQWRGGQANFTDAKSGTVVHVPAFVHAISEFVNSARAAGLVLEYMDERLEADAPPGAPPRLLTLRFAKPGAAR
jgi:malonyl-CoA O-methyltransferase